MPIKDVLWACPICHRIESIGPDGGCAACSAAFSRGAGANIRVTHAGGTDERSVAAWLARLPWADLDGDGRSLPGGIRAPFVQPAQVRQAAGDQPVRRGSDCLGFVEQFGPPIDGELELTDETLAFSLPGGGGWRCSLLDVTAISPASSAIQLKTRGMPAVSVRFPAGSIRLWEQRLQYCVRRAFSRAGQGEITEFQPRVRTQ